MFLIVYNSVRWRPIKVAIQNVLIQQVSLREQVVLPEQLLVQE
jgi:hypothetical protein